MRLLIFLALVLLVPLGQAAVHTPSIPKQFQGEWNANLSDCKVGDSDSRLRIAPQSLSYYESSGAVRAVVTRGNNEIALIVELSGEGETWLATEHLKLSPDGNRLESIAQAGAPFVRFRCPGKYR